MKQADYIFVYGTLMRKCEPNTWSAQLQNKAKFLGDATTTGELYLVDFYPGIIKGNGLVHGEIYQFDQESLLKVLDEYEDCNLENPSNSLYIRERQPCKLNCNGKELNCWVYFYNQSITGLRRIENGIFI